MVRPFNPGFHEEPRYQPAPVIPLKQEESLLTWLENTGRLVAYESIEYYYEDEDEEMGEMINTIEIEEFTAEEEDIEI